MTPDEGDEMLFSVTQKSGREDKTTIGYTIMKVSQSITAKFDNSYNTHKEEPKCQNEPGWLILWFMATIFWDWAR